MGSVVDLAAGAAVDASLEAALRIAAYDQGSVIVAGLTTQGRLAAVSGAVQRVLGWPVPLVVGCDTLDVVHPADRSGVLGARRALEAGTGAQVTLRVRRRTRGWRVMAVSAWPLAEPVGEMVAIAEAVDVTSTWRRLQSLEHEASHDALTQLPNRREFADRLKAALSRQHRTGGALVVFYMDLDGLKAVNDTYGHTRGDRLLQQAANAMRQVMRGQDTLARLGGDEFAALMEDLHPDNAEGEAAAAATRIREVVAQTVREDNLPAAGISLGHVVAVAGHLMDAQALLELADQRMYDDKTARAREHDSASPQAKPR